MGGFCDEINTVIVTHSSQIHAIAYSLPNSQYQNAHWIFMWTNNDLRYNGLCRLTDLASEYRQDSIAFMEGAAQFLKSED